MTKMIRRIGGYGGEIGTKMSLDQLLCYWTKSTLSQNSLSVYVPYFTGSYVILFDYLHHAIASGVIPYFFVRNYVTGIPCLLCAFYLFSQYG